MSSLNIYIGYDSKEDIAYACQKTAEDITLNEIKLVLDSFDYQSVSIGLAGGVFANVRINQLIYELKQVNNIFVHPAMGDSGLSHGSAILAELKISAKVINFSEFFPYFVKMKYRQCSKKLQNFIESLKNAVSPNSRNRCSHFVNVE